VIGIGLNVNVEEHDFPDGTPRHGDVPPDLRREGVPPGRRPRPLLDAFGTRYAEFIGGGFASLPRRMGPPGLPPGATRPSSAAGRRGVGNRDGLDTDGALRFSRRRPAIESVHSGEILDFRR